MNFIFFSSIIAIYCLAIFTAAQALLHKKDSKSAFGWIAIIFMLPIPGIIFYWLFGIARVDSRASLLMEKAAYKVLGGEKDLHTGFFVKEPQGFIDSKSLPVNIAKLSMPGQKISDRYVVGENSVYPLYNGEEVYPKMLEAISKTNHRVYLSTFIFGNDFVGTLFIKTINEAAIRGCEVKILLDGIGSFFPIKGWRKKLHPTIKLAYFLSPSLLPPQFSINLRNHRKILVCDSNIAFTGGMNISQHHLVTLKKPNRVQDIHFYCAGPIAKQLEIAFLLDWSFATGEAARIPFDPIKKQGSTLCRLIIDGPGSPHETIHDLFCAMSSSAQKNIRIMSPYFLPTPQLSEALASAVLRGVTVDIIIPLKNNHYLLQWAMAHQAPQLVDKNIHLFLQPPPFAHTKLLLIDNDYTLMGSANLDPRSLNLNFELVVENFSTTLTNNLIEFFDKKKSQSYQLTEHTKLPSLPIRLRNAASWLFSPYL